MSRRFFVDGPLDCGTVELSTTEARHLRDVMRISVGEQVELFNGEGVTAHAVVASVSKRKVDLTVESRTFAERPASTVTIISAVPKGDRFRWMIEKLSELNVDRFIPLKTERSVVSPRDTKLDRMHQVVISAAKQCRQIHLMKIEPLADFDTVLERFGSKILLASPGGQSVAQLNRVQSVVFLIGPEGGLTPQEVATAVSAGATEVGLAKNILRIETAAIVAATLGENILKDDEPA